jgi:hypothetical protein
MARKKPDARSADEDPRLHEAALLRRVTAAVQSCWDEGNPIAGWTATGREGTARVVIRRFRSFARRNVAADDHERQVRDIAKGLIAAFNEDPKLVGPLIIDYNEIAERALEAIYRHLEEG